LLLVLLMYFFQRKMLYFPTQEPEETHFQVQIIDSDGLKIKVVVDNPEFEQAVIYFGGNGENVYEAAKRMKGAFADRAAYYVNYPGYGGSTGTPAENTIIQAARDVYTYVSHRHHSPALVGRSLGTGVAVNLASEYAVPRLVLISPYGSIDEVASSHYPFLPTRWLLKDKFESASLANEITANVLIIMAADDKVIAPKHSLDFVEAFKKDLSSKELSQRLKIQIYADADHNNVHLHSGFLQQISDFLGE